MAGLALLGGRGGSRPASADVRSFDGIESTQPDSTRTLEDEEELRTIAMRHLRGADVENVVDVAALGVAAQSATRMAEISESSLVPATPATFDVSADGALEIGGQEIVYPEGIRGTLILFYQHEQGVLWLSQEFSEPVDGVGTYTHRLNVDQDFPDGPRLTTAARSINGAIPRELEDADLRTMSQNPCGGCNGVCQTSGEELTNQCNWDWTWSCIGSVGGCAVCMPCSIKWQCLACVALSCGSIMSSCCSSYTTLCARCQRVC